MKSRFGFVSNSSSSSFVCQICGKVESGWDANPSDFGFVECENGHLFCMEELFDDAIPMTEEMDDENFDDASYYGASLYSEKYCPICAFSVSSKPEIKQYLKTKYGITDEEVFAEVKKQNPRRKKLYENEYVNYVYNKFEIQEQELLKSLKEEFNGSYKKFKEYLNEK